MQRMRRAIAGRGFESVSRTPELTLLIPSLPVGVSTLLSSMRPVLLYRSSHTTHRHPAMAHTSPVLQLERLWEWPQMPRSQWHVSFRTGTPEPREYLRGSTGS